MTPDYSIGPKILGEINVWDNADLSKQEHVSPDGRISLHLLGNIPAIEKTVGQSKLKAS
ncbi:polysaccharide biosynthesis/export family protein [Nitrospira sp. BLG_2]|uniref:polysaccharide biosynthesis/export family protein n=1 Tax=Nitrospira sp. BLG_2 TaxID=3397507 RepID=UPI003B9D1A26